MDAPKHLSFRVVQARIERLTDELWKDALALVIIDPEDFAKTRDHILSRRAEVELAGVRAFDRLRHLNGDDTAYIWEPYVRKMMIARLLELFEQPDDEGGAGAKPPGPRGGPGPRPGRVESERVARRMNIDRPGGRGTRCVATRDDLSRAAYTSARHQTLNIVGSWSADSAEVEDIQQIAATKAVDRCERRWNPERSPLLAYLHLCVNSVIREEFRMLCTRKKRREQISAASMHWHREDVRLAAHSDEADPSRAYLTERTGGDDPYQLQRVCVRDALDQLSERQYDEVLRRLLHDTPGTNADQIAYGRAITRLRRLLAVPGEHAGLADGPSSAGELSA